MIARSNEKSPILVAADGNWDPDGAGDPGVLVDRRCYKTLSLRLAGSSGIPVPKSLLLIQNMPTARHWAWRNWQTPLIIRVDYSGLPRKKVLGGITIASSETLDRICDWLSRESYYPLVHPFLDRFRNIYSAGVLITRDSFEASIELVGTGFDASDLRLRVSRPHESFEVDLRNDSLSSHLLATAKEYAESRERRLQSIMRLRAYTELVDSEGCLLSDLSDIDVSDRQQRSASELVPGTYAQLPEVERRDLVRLCRRLHDDVVPFLPRSATYAASFTYFADLGWLLWDVYGEWYVR